jgi:hypothetical protein
MKAAAAPSIGLSLSGLASLPAVFPEGGTALPAMNSHCVAHRICL